jgi:hypothetical protein
MALNLWTVGEEAMADAAAQAATGNSLINVPTAAGRGEIKNQLADSGDMWIASARTARMEREPAESLIFRHEVINGLLLSESEDN